MKVIIGDGKFEKGLKLFKKKVEDFGILKKFKEKEFYVKLSIARKLKKSSAKKRWQKFTESNKLPVCSYQ